MKKGLIFGAICFSLIFVIIFTISFVFAGGGGGGGKEACSTNEQCGPCGYCSDTGSCHAGNAQVECAGYWEGVEDGCGSCQPISSPELRGENWFRCISGDISDNGDCKACFCDAEGDSCQYEFYYEPGLNCCVSDEDCGTCGACVEGNGKTYCIKSLNLDTFGCGDCGNCVQEGEEFNCRMVETSFPCGDCGYCFDLNPNLFNCEAREDPCGECESCSAVPGNCEFDASISCGECGTCSVATGGCVGDNPQGDGNCEFCACDLGVCWNVPELEGTSCNINDILGACNEFGGCVTFDTEDQSASSQEEAANNFIEDGNINNFISFLEGL